MKLFLPILSITLLAMSCHNQKSASNSNLSPDQFMVTGKVEQKLTYCGGAKPTQDIIDNLKSPKALKNFKLYIKKDELNHQNALPIDSTVTNEQGHFKISLPQGNYIFLSELQLSQAKFEANLPVLKLTITNQNLLNNHFNNGLKKFAVAESNVIDLNILIQKKCDIPEGILGVKSTTMLRP
jgi:hypothetical protein